MTKRYNVGGKKVLKKPWNPKASADPPRRYHIKGRTVTTGAAAMDALIRKLDEDAKKKKHRSDARTRVGGGSPGSFVAGGLARTGRER